MNLIDVIPNTAKGRVLADQIMRSATSVAANDRAACRARSKSEFISKIGTVVEEADETLFWLELIHEGKMLPLKKLESLLGQANELVAIMNASRITAKANAERK